MKVILNKDVPKVGRKFETKDVAAGFARNYLLPRKLAERATKDVLARVELQRSVHEEQLQLAEAELMKQLEKLSKTTISVEGKANDQGHLFAGIHEADLADLIKEQAKIDLPAAYLELEKPIKEVGEHKVPIIVQDKKIEITVIVTEIA